MALYLPSRKAFGSVGGAATAAKSAAASAASHAAAGEGAADREGGAMDQTVFASGEGMEAGEVVRDMRRRPAGEVWVTHQRTQRESGGCEAM